MECRQKNMLIHLVLKPSTTVIFQLIANVRFTKNNDDNNRSHIYKVSPETNSTVHVEPKNNTNFALLGNFFTSNGLGGEVSAN